jgi:O-antigen ligase
MLIPALLMAAAALLVAGVWVRSASVVAMSLAIVVVGYAFGYDVWHAAAGPVPLTLDRLLLLGVLGECARRWWFGDALRTRPTALDWGMGLVLVWLTVSCFASKPGDDVHLPTSPTFRLIVSFWVPAILYAMLRHERIDERLARSLLIGLACLGVYLGVTALLETARVWSLVFPRYIADPTLGLHYGRARGPALNSVSLGVHLGVCAAAAWLLIPQAGQRMKLFWFGSAGVMALGVLLTYTRSTWIGLAMAIVVVMTLQLPKAWRTTAFATAIVCGGLFLAVGKDALVALSREDRGDVSAHSVQQRASFAYVSYQMFCDHPLWGVGFGRFYDQKLPYLTDRRQSFELESIRPLHHHNTFLSLLTETGVVGLGAYLAVLTGIGRVGWRLAHDEQVGGDCRRLGLLAIGALAVYLPSALFHDLSLVHSDQWLLFTVAGAAAGCWMNTPRTTNSRNSSPLAVAPPLASPLGAAFLPQRVVR